MADWIDTLIDDLFETIKRNPGLIRDRVREAIERHAAASHTALGDLGEANALHELYRKLSLHEKEGLK